MSNTIEDKISLFTKVIIERIESDFQKKQENIIENHKNRAKNIIDDYEEEKILTIEKISKEAQSRKQGIVLKTRSNMRLAVLKKKKELMERIFREVKKRVKTFVQTDEYTIFLAEVIKKVLSRFSKDQFVCFKFSNNDIKKRQELILKTINSTRSQDTYQIDTDDRQIGGVFVESGDGRLEIDYTINTILEESHKLIVEVLFSWLDRDKEK
ncbi:MAG: V-type ATP synthase subunit E [Atribacterota bacterium]|jgi:V/A-type H+-transporting ATPase subunit E|nr:V-type ATP synthase subunit E [Atribacterota bacterium]MDD4895431.1 V-type ATP synthase subunit E [Atribacterota bacterium]MDD5636821.1 V-type ATP synthase subunit E [Atribacterota bacterium]